MDEQSEGDIDGLAASALEHDVVAPLDLARHLLASVLSSSDDTVARDRVGVVADALGEVQRRAHGLAEVLRPPPAPRREPSSLRGLARAAWEAVAVDEAALDVVVASGTDDRVVADVDRFVSVLSELLAFAVCRPDGDPAHVTVTMRRAEQGLELSVHDTGGPPVARRRHELGSLCFARTLRIVGQNVDVDEADGVRTSVTVSEDLVRGTTAQ